MTSYRAGYSEAQQYLQDPVVFFLSFYTALPSSVCQMVSFWSNNGCYGSRHGMKAQQCPVEEVLLLKFWLCQQEIPFPEALQPTSSHVSLTRTSPTQATQEEARRYQDWLQPIMMSLLKAGTEALFPLSSWPRRGSWVPGETYPFWTSVHL